MGHHASIDIIEHSHSQPGSRQIGTRRESSALGILAASASARNSGCAHFVGATIGPQKKRAASLRSAKTLTRPARTHMRDDGSRANQQPYPCPSA